MNNRPESIILGGGAPSCWKQTMERAAARAVDLHRYCTWVAEMAAPQPPLREEPPFGYCLAALMAVAERPVAEEPGGQADRTTHRWPGIGHKQPPELRRAEIPCTAPTPIPPRSPRHFGVPADLSAECFAPSAPRQVDWEMLCRLAGEPQSPDEEEAPRHDVPGPADGYSASRGPVSRPRAAGPPQRRVGSAERRIRAPDMTPEEHQAWRRDVLLRITNAFRRVASVAPAEQTTLAEDLWSIPLAGPAAPEELLIRLAVPSPHRPRSPSAQSDTEVHQPLTPPETSPPGEPRRRPPPLSPIDERQAAVEWPTVNGDEPVGAPLVDGQHLPPLVPPAHAGAPASAAGAETVQRTAMIEAVPEGEDLALLANKIKRILDDEARRHGIDV